MALTINTNVMSLNAQRNTAQTQGQMAVTLQRLSSGLRVNSAKDDAAGLAIAERMNTQVRGMNVAIRNANDGISLAQVAEGGLATMSDMLQRMRELAVQSINSTNTSGDIVALNQEYTQLSQEVARTLSSVQFNGQSLFTTNADFTFQVGANSGQTITIASAQINLQSGAGLSGVIAGGAVVSALVPSANLENAANLTALDAALATINSTRANLGAVQSRFENAINYLRTAVENQAAARGRIMDADFAAETASLSRSQILQQAGTAMIAQANQIPQGVLRLLQG
ncbi:flagellin N-terminal helical domain-containing protein [Serpentinimonas barnesii]|uniref:flagellin N-terminal helical domain-containing protein n=1 Tax=Serpentinimonas barnesii TaxID=1458427 RepID=UPI000495954E|nr:flagellin [Serpentinimonas barnesii]